MQELSAEFPTESQHKFSAEATALPETGASVVTQRTTPDLPGIRKVVQLGDMYILVETDEGIRLLDQHALHEKGALPLP